MVVLLPATREEGEARKARKGEGEGKKSVERGVLNRTSYLAKKIQSR